jgi:hypothetical protein
MSALASRRTLYLIYHVSVPGIARQMLWEKRPVFSACAVASKEIPLPVKIEMKLLPILLVLL